MAYQFNSANVPAGLSRVPTVAEPRRIAPPDTGALNAVSNFLYQYSDNLQRNEDAARQAQEELELQGAVYDFEESLRQRQVETRSQPITDYAGWYSAQKAEREQALAARTSLFSSPRVAQAFQQNATRMIQRYNEADSTFTTGLFAQHTVAETEKNINRGLLSLGQDPSDENVARVKQQFDAQEAATISAYQLLGRDATAEIAKRRAQLPEAHLGSLTAAGQDPETRLALVEQGKLLGSEYWDADSYNRTILNLRSEIATKYDQQYRQQADLFNRSYEEQEDSLLLQGTWQLQESDLKALRANPHVDQKKLESAEFLMAKQGEVSKIIDTLNGMTSAQAEIWVDQYLTPSRKNRVAPDTVSERLKIVEVAKKSIAARNRLVEYDPAAVLTPQQMEALFNERGVPLNKRDYTTREQKMKYAQVLAQTVQPNGELQIEQFYQTVQQIRAEAGPGADATIANSLEMAGITKDQQSLAKTMMAWSSSADFGFVQKAMKFRPDAASLPNNIKSSDIDKLVSTSPKIRALKQSMAALPSFQDSEGVAHINKLIVNGTLLELTANPGLTKEQALSSALEKVLPAEPVDLSFSGSRISTLVPKGKAQEFVGRVKTDLAFIKANKERYQVRGASAPTPPDVPLKDTPDMSWPNAKAREFAKPYVQAAAQKYNIDPKLLASLLQQESGFYHRRKGELLGSSAGAGGVAQFMPATAASFGFHNNNYRDSIFNAAKYLSQGLKKYNGDVTRAVAGYNAGYGAVDKHGGIPPYKETQNYVSNILSMYRSTQFDDFAATAAPLNKVGIDDAEVVVLPRGGDYGKQYYYIKTKDASGVARYLPIHDSKSGSQAFVDVRDAQRTVASRRP